MKSSLIDGHPVTDECHDRYIYPGTTRVPDWPSCLFVLATVSHPGGSSKNVCLRPPIPTSRGSPDEHPSYFVSSTLHVSSRNTCFPHLQQELHAYHVKDIVLRFAIFSPYRFSQTPISRRSASMPSSPAYPLCCRARRSQNCLLLESGLLRAGIVSG